MNLRDTAIAEYERLNAVQKQQQEQIARENATRARKALVSWAEKLGAEITGEVREHPDTNTLDAYAETDIDGLTIRCYTAFQHNKPYLVRSCEVCGCELLDNFANISSLGQLLSTPPLHTCPEE